MRKITLDAYKAFMNNKNWTRSNTTVEFDNDGFTHLYLFGNKIAMKDLDKRISISDQGWCTNVTQERLSMFDIKLRREKGVWIVNEKEAWDGRWKYINEFKS